MRHTKLLFTGVALAVTGGVLLLAGRDPTARDLAIEAARLWPAALIALGIVLLVRRTRIAVVATLAAAITAGLVVGGAVVAAPDLKAPCPQDRAGATETRGGSFAGPGSVDLAFACGEIRVGTAPGTAWQLDSLRLGDARAVIAQEGDALSIETTHEAWSFGRRPLGDAWQLTLPTGTPMTLEADIDAADADLDLAGLRLGALDLEANAADVRLDLGAAAVERFDLEINAGQAVLTLPSAGDVTGSIHASAARVELCVPAGVGLVVTRDVALGDIDLQGLVRVGDTWQTPDLASTRYRADLTIEATAASVVVDPEGGC